MSNQYTAIWARTGGIINLPSQMREELGIRVKTLNQNAKTCDNKVCEARNDCARYVQYMLDIMSNRPRLMRAKLRMTHKAASGPKDSKGCQFFKAAPHVRDQGTDIKAAPDAAPA